MIHEVKARYSNGAIIPLEPLDVEIEEGATLSISISVEPKSAHALPNAKVDTADKDDADAGDCLNCTLDALYIEDYFEKARQ